jgi:hypothetical protein
MAGASIVQNICNPLTLNDAGYIGAAAETALQVVATTLIDIAIQEYVAKEQRRARKTIADMVDEMSARQMALAESIAGQASAFYPAEAAFVADAFGEAKHYSNWGAAAAGWKNFATEANAAGREAWLKESRAMCMPPTRCDDARWSNMTAKTVVDTQNFALRKEEARTDALNDRRYARQYNAVKLGQGRVGSGASYAVVAGGIATSLSQTLGNMVNSVAPLVGYLSSRVKDIGWTTDTQPAADVTRATNTNAVVLNTGIGNLGVPLDTISIGATANGYTNTTTLSGVEAASGVMLGVEP